MESEFKSCFVEMKLEKERHIVFSEFNGLIYDFHEADSVGLKMQLC